MSGDALGFAAFGSSPTNVAERLRLQLAEVVKGEYEVIRSIGRGGMGVVYLARDVALQRNVAIKVLVGDLFHDSTTVARFRREAQTAAALSHPNIVPVHAVREQADLVFFVMQFIEGDTVEQSLKALGPLPLEYVWETLIQIGGALDHAHMRGVVHRDVKPANVIVDAEGRAFIMDFGIAKVQESNDLTSTGCLVGTPTYASPEQCMGDPAIPASDQYCLGVLLYEMLAGAPPFQAVTLGRMIQHHLKDPPPPIQGCRPDCPDDLSRIIHRMLAKDPTERWHAIGDAIEELGEDRLRRPYTPASHAQPSKRNWDQTSSDDRNREQDDSLDVGEIDSFEQNNSPRRQRSTLALGIVGMLVMLGLSAAWAYRPTDFKPRPRPSESPRGATVASFPGTDSTSADALGPTQTDEISPAMPPSLSTDRNRDVGRKTPRTVGTEVDTLTPNTEPDVNLPARLILGTRGTAAVLYINGAAVGGVSRLRTWSLAPGEVHLSIQAEGCVPWDTTVTTSPGGEVRIGYRHPACPVQAGGRVR